MTPLDVKHLYRRIESLFSGLPATRGADRAAAHLVQGLLEHLGEPLGLRSAQLYRRDGSRVVQIQGWGDSRPDLADELTRRLDSGGAEGIPELPWAGHTEAGFAGLLPLNAERTLLGVLHTDGDADIAAARLNAALSALHYGLGQQRHRHELEDVMQQARAIQTSLLPEGLPTFPGYDIAAMSVPAQSVGGDLYDFIPLDAETLAVAVADASGHGLPAALQARDVVTGLRMGVERDLKITRIVEKLNRVIHRSGLSSRFVSMVFGELEANGNFAYINAGHPPPLLLDASGFRELTVGGTVLGPIPDSVYKLGFAHVDRGAMLVLYTDGVIERGAERGHSFDTGRLMEWMEAWREGPARVAVADLFERLRVFGDGGPFEDDVTVMLLRRSD